MANKQPVLLIEDNEDDIILTKRAFEKNNITNEIIIARHGDDAIDLLFGDSKQRPLNPALILLDLKLPKVPGLEVLQEIRKNKLTLNIPVIILTGSKEEDDLVKSYKNGANSYVRKPVNFNAFTNAIKDIGVYWLVLNEPPPPQN